VDVWGSGCTMMCVRVCRGSFANVWGFFDLLQVDLCENTMECVCYVRICRGSFVHVWGSLADGFV